MWQGDSIPFTLITMNNRWYAPLVRAIEADECNTDVEECLRLYGEAYSVMKDSLQSDSAAGVCRERLVTFVTQVEGRISEIEAGEKRSCDQQQISQRLELTKKQHWVDTDIARSILNEMVPNTQYKFSDIIGQDAAKDALRGNIIFPSLNPKLFTGLRTPDQGLLLYGSPGNGKTMLALAAANESNHLLLSISASTLVSKYLGESEKHMRTLFQVARRIQPCIVFIDEVDAILSCRNDAEHEASRRLKTEFLLQIDGASSSKSDRILVLGATNRPQDLDEAVLRRFPIKIPVANPSMEDRERLLNTLLKSERHELTPTDIRDIAVTMKNSSAADLTTLAKHAAKQSIRELDRDQLSSMAPDRLRPIRAEDFEISIEDLREFNSDIRYLKK